MPFLTANGVRFYYELHGPEAGEPLVLNNGIFATTAGWARVLPALARRYRVLAYDLRGQGQSEHPAGPYSLDLHAADLRALLDALGWPRAHLVGTSYGGELNLVMGLRYPERCQTLTVITAVAYSGPHLAATVERWRLAAEGGDGPRFFRAIYADIYSEAYLAANPALAALGEQRYAAFDLAAGRRLIESFQAFDVRGELPKITTPTCVVAAEGDTLKPRRYSEQIQQAIAGAELHVIPQAGHAVMLERPAELVTVILGFLAQHPLAGA
jgi:3-oxoadipate enol-lactonase